MAASFWSPNTAATIVLAPSSGGFWLPRRRVLRAIFLHHVQDDRQKHDGGDDGEAGRVSGHGRHAGRRDQDENQGIAKAGQEGAQQRGAIATR